uniref:Uncharacterized protein n=1 Tax=Triticum urartu TaxID=4572 RepID=A0A8R7UWX9_TRIUA
VIIMSEKGDQSLLLETFGFFPLCSWGFADLPLWRIDSHKCHLSRGVLD